VEAFVWDQNFATGLTVVDEEHHVLVRLINQLGKALIQGEAGTPESLQAAFGQLADYTRRHFAAEEALMRDCAVSPRHLARHHEYHVEFVEQLKALWAGRASMSDPAEVLHGTLRSWLAFHILGVDQSMARQVGHIRAGMPPEEAFELELSHRDPATQALLGAIGSLYQVLSRQNADLLAANRGLEERVARRTRELDELNRRLESLSNSDSLLGIANRRRFDQALDTEWRRGLREKHPLSLLMIDVDHFKRYNDFYGHPAGDRCLQVLARAAGEPGVLRRPADLLARYGGEELVVLLPNTTLAGALSTAQRIRSAITGLHIEHADSPVAAEVTVSIGVATAHPEPHSTPAALMAAADRGLYAAKAAGRNRVSAA